MITCTEIAWQHVSACHPPSSPQLASFPSNLYQYSITDAGKKREGLTGDMRSFKTHIDEYVRNSVVQLVLHRLFIKRY
jgi:hypothetical protein